MSEIKTGEPSGSAEAIPAPVKAPQRDWVPSLIWLIPILAAVIGIALAVQTWIQRGPEITIAFRSAEGLEAGKTKVKYKEVDIGTVQSIKLSKDRSRVLVTVLLEREAKSFTATDSRFWVVRPRVAGSGVSGLGTLLFGAYIGADAGIENEKTDKFTGLEVPPIITRDASGKQYVLRASDIGSLDIGSPVYYRRIKVGQVTAFDLDDDGKGITIRIFIDAPYDKFVGINTRFWHASGFDMQINASGFTLNTQSLATVMLGGLSFQAPDENPGPPAKENTAYVLAESEAEALREQDGEATMIVLYFKQSVRGLVPGAEVSFRGLTLGHVKSVGIEYDPKQQEFSMPVLVEVYPERLGRKFIESQRQSKYTPQQRLQFMINRGLGAQLRTGNLLTGQIYIAFDFFPKIVLAKKDAGKTASADTPGALLQLPTIPSSAEALETQVSEIAFKLSKVPFDQIGDDLQQSLKELKGTLNSTAQLAEKLNNDVAPEITTAMKDVSKTLSAAERTLSEDAPLQQDLRQTLQELARAAASLRILTDYFELHPQAVIRGKQKDKQ
ncbi:intermembrane transport protein PqiB [Nitrosospira sp. NpAV]|uniref:PqiB family protein n=1 Tax=Nitrosospira sp. NpAV TaxID=58133 RepID=UPI00059FCDED|nr:MlaD family protein [Nitrosospira sp. NpAV]KIO49760.1 mammalian cell entry protein [Nitrosospira sp. NpAV]